MPPVHHVACHTWAAPIRRSMCAIPRMRNPRFSSDQSRDLASRWGSPVLPINRWIHTHALCAAFACLCPCWPDACSASGQRIVATTIPAPPPAWQFRSAHVDIACWSFVSTVYPAPVTQSFAAVPGPSWVLIHRLKHPCITRSVPTAGSQREAVRVQYWTEPSLCFISSRAAAFRLPHRSSVVDQASPSHCPAPSFYQWP
ncbi:hypothetical protein V8C44DRAFT_285056 [Trichoderma aethiopicum]